MFLRAWANAAQKDHVFIYFEGQNCIVLMGHSAQVKAGLRHLPGPSGKNATIHQADLVPDKGYYKLSIGSGLNGKK